MNYNSKPLGLKAAMALAVLAATLAGYVDNNMVGWPVAGACESRPN